MNNKQREELEHKRMKAFAKAHKIDQQLHGCEPWKPEEIQTLGKKRKR